MVQDRVAQHEVERAVGERQRPRVAVLGLDLDAERDRVGAQRGEHPGRDVGARRGADDARLQEVQREVPGPGADLERPRERSGLGAEQLASLPRTCVDADRAELHAPLVVVLGRRDVVVAAVDVEDRLGLAGAAIAAESRRPQARRRRLGRLAQARRERGVSAPSLSRQRHAPRAVPGRFMRASEPSPSTSWACTIATRAGDANARRISAHHGSRSPTPAAATARVDLGARALRQQRLVPAAHRVVVVRARVDDPVLDVVGAAGGGRAGSSRVEAELQHDHARQAEAVAQALDRRA